MTSLRGTTIRSQMLHLLIVFASCLNVIDATHNIDGMSICPNRCKCSSLYNQVLCPGLELTTLPKNISYSVTSIDLSNNLYQIIPGELSQYTQLKELILKHNKITHLTAKGLKNSSLEKLDISHNLIRKWTAIYHALTNKHSLYMLDISHNNIRDVESTTMYLNSSTLHSFKLENCSIANIPDQFLTKLTNLQTLILSHNIHLSTLRNLTSESLESLDISNCNFETVNLSNLPNLQTLNLAGNRISRLPQYFLQNIKLKMLDLSSNAIKTIHENAFIKLPALEELNLSTNVVNDMKLDTFIANRHLKTLNISRSYLTKILQLNSTSLQSLDLSVNEIQEFPADSLTFMSSLKDLRVSRNLISKLPNRIKSTTLKSLDLSTCQIIDFHPDTFLHLKNLEDLNLANNKLTGLKINHLPSRLSKLDLNNNLWRCDCYSNDFKDLYYFLYPRIVTGELICQSPENVSGRTWLRACANVWSSRSSNYAVAENFWLYLILAVIVLSMILCIVISIRRLYKIKLVRLQQERERHRSEAQDRIRRLRLHEQQQQSQQNAPDPRELVRPPSYAEAIRLPRIDGSYSSLAGSRPSLAAISNVDLSRKKKERQTNAQATLDSSKTKITALSAAQTSGTSSLNGSVVTSDHSSLTERRHNNLDLESSSDDEACAIMIVQ